MKLTKERYGIAFPFGDSPSGFFLQTTATPREEIRANLIHLLLTKKGSRFFLPDFGTRLYEFVFEPLDGTEEYTAKITVEYTIKDNVFESSDVIVLNL